MFRQGRYAVIIFEDIYTYLNMNKDFRPWFDKYLVQFNVGLICFHPPPEEVIEDISFQQVRLNITYHHHNSLHKK